MAVDDPAGPAPDTPGTEPDALASPGARPLPADSHFQADPARLAEGWEPRFIIEGRRAEDCVKLYELLGFEAVAEPVRAEQALEGCTDCRIMVLLEFRLIYTRARPSSAVGPGA